MMKKVLVKAYLTGNLGDDLMVRLLCSRYPGVSFTIIGRRRFKEGFADLQNVNYISSDNIAHKIIYKVPGFAMRTNLFGYADVLLHTKKYDDYIIVGGSMFIQDSQYKKKTLVDKAWIDKGAYIVGCNFGPYYSKDFLDFYISEFNKSKGITTRDRYTYKLFENLENVHYAPDVVFNYRENKGNTENAQIVISLVGYAKMQYSKQKYLLLLKKIVHSITNMGFKPVFISFCKGEGDEEVIKDCKDDLNIDVESVYYDGTNIADVLERISNAHGVIAGRFHAMILALLFHKRCLPLIYSDKMKNVLNDIGFTDDIYDLTLKQEYSDVKQNVFVSKEYFTLGKSYIEQAEEQFIYLDKALI